MARARARFVMTDDSPKSSNNNFEIPHPHIPFTGSCRNALCCRDAAYNYFLSNVFVSETAQKLSETSNLGIIYALIKALIFYNNHFSNVELCRQLYDPQTTENLANVPEFLLKNTSATLEMLRFTWNATENATKSTTSQFSFLSPPVAQAPATRSSHSRRVVWSSVKVLVLIKQTLRVRLVQ